MSQPKVNSFFLPLIFLLGFIFFFIKFAGPLVTHIFYHNNIAWLNQIIGIGSDRPLAFYEGLMMERFLGPASQIVSSVCLILVALRYFILAAPIQFFFLVLVYLFLTKFEVLLSPVYGESGAGPVAEAIWLYRNHFDYLGLFNQLNVNYGGPKVYFSSIYPGLAALLMTITPSVKVFFLIYSALTFVLSAMGVTAFRQILLKVVDAKTALLTALLLLVLPLYQSMTELKNMEMLCLFFAVLSAYFLAERKIGLASLMAMGAAAVKVPGVLVCAGVCLGTVFLLFFDPKERLKIKNVFWVLGTAVFAVLMIYGFRVLVGTSNVPSGNISFFVGWAPVSGCKFLVASFTACLGGFFAIIVRKLMSKKKHEQLWLERFFIPLLGLIFTTMWFAMYLNLSVMGPRYKLLLAPFLMLSCVFVFTYFVKSQKIVHSILVIAILLSCLGAYGLFHPTKVQSHTYSFNELERSLEYRNDLKLDQVLAKTIEEEYADYHIGAPFVVAQMLALPELGYVTKPLDVTVYGMSLHYGGIKNFSGLEEMPVRKSVWIGFKKSEFVHNIPFPVDPQHDRIVREIVWGDKEAVLFQGGFAVERMRRVFEFIRSESLRQLNPNFALDTKQRRSSSHKKMPALACQPGQAKGGFNPDKRD